MSAERHAEAVDALAKALRDAINKDCAKIEEHHRTAAAKSRSENQHANAFAHQQVAEAVRVAIVTAQAAVNRVLGVN